MFSAGFLTVLIYAALVWCAVSALVLGTMLLRDMLKGETW